MKELKEKLLNKLIKIIYLVCCIVVIATPNTIGSTSEVNGEVQNTEIEFAPKSIVNKYKNQLDALGEKVLKEHEGITSFLVMKDGKLFYEKYYNGNNQKTLFEVHSCTKTVIALLTGIAVDQGMIGNEDSSYLSMFKGLMCSDVTNGFGKIKIKDMLTMTSGINWDRYSESFSVRYMIISKGTKYGLELIPTASISASPGQRFFYNSNESRSLMALVAYNSKMEDIEFAEKYLFDKVDIYDFIWPYNDSGLLPGGKDLFLCSRDLARLGQVMLDDGNYKGEQIVSEEWVKKMMTVSKEDVECMDIVPADKIDYGFYLWHVKHKEYDIYFAYGRGGQYIFMVPDMNICVVTSSIDKVRSDNYRKIVFDVIDMFEGDIEDAKIH